MSFKRCMRLARAAEPESVKRAQRLIYPRMFDAGLLASQTEQVLKTLGKSTGVGYRALYKDWQDFKHIELQKEQRTQQGENTSPYRVINGALHRDKDTEFGPVPVPLCNFDASIIREEIRDDGAEKTFTFVIEGKLKNGQPLPATEVPAARYPGMKWVTEAWGVAPLVFAGQSTNDHLRVAIQERGGEVPRHIVYAHLGWRKIDDKWFYLHAAGAVGADGTCADVEVHPGDSRLSGYELPDPPEGEALREAVRTSLGLLELAPPRLSFPLLATIYLAPLGEASPADLSVFLLGLTGTFKTELTALAQAHFGAGFDGRNLPANWSSTANALEKQAFLAKDALLTIDDFSPTGSQSDVARAHRDAERLLRAQGNRAGRERMRTDGSLRPAYYPRGLILSSGEDAPKGHSLRARVFFLEVTKGDVRPAALTVAQQQAGDGSYAAAMSGYVRWLAPRMDGLKTELAKLKRTLRDRATRHATHRRTPDQVAALAAGLHMLLQYALEVGVITSAEQADLWERSWTAIGEAAAKQGGLQETEDPVTRFGELLSAAVASGHAHLADAKTGKVPREPQRWGWRCETPGTNFTCDEWQSQGERVGWVSDDALFLEPDAAYASVRKLARAQGDNLSMAKRTLYKRMGERELLVSSDKDRSTKRLTVAGEVRATIHLQKDYLVPENVPNVQNGPTPPEWEEAADGLEDNEGRERTDAGVKRTTSTEDGEQTYRNEPPSNHSFEGLSTFGTKEGAISPSSTSDEPNTRNQPQASHADVPEQETRRYLAWAEDLLARHPCVWLESPAPVDPSQEMVSQFKEPEKLAARRTLLDDKGLWGVVTAKGGVVLESWSGEAEGQQNPPAEAA